MRRFLVLGIVLLGGVIAAVSNTHGQDQPASTPSADDPLSSELGAKEAELQELQEKIRVLKDARSKKEGEQSRLTDAVEILEDRVKQARLELDYTRVSIEEARIRIRQTTEELGGLSKKQERLREQMRLTLRLLATVDERSPLETFLTGDTFADFFSTQQALVRIQTHATALLVQTQELKTAREAREADLRNRRDDLQQLAKLQAAQRAALQEDESRKRTALSRTAAEAARLSSLVTEAEEARREIQQEIFLLRNAGIRLSLKQAEDFARFAGSAAGVRPALLLGVLKVESNIGTNVGSGRYPDDIHPDHRDAFLRVTKRLDLDPATTPVSAKPTSYAGWGGAMGPGQILPGIWERIESDVARITGKEIPSPFELLDAFVGTAVILRNAGAASGSEFEAVNRYFAGPNWQRFTWYGDRVLAVAKEYEARGL
ncbi:MAG: hypothetical protein G01um101438_184 [Parcubacteria group bacterium Gr01-1014_38]|nr:MAG: hypothetical protein G01um101438_184 [Parcubacteria group bacterium Gr01-1014_38]